MPDPNNPIQDQNPPGAAPAGAPPVISPQVDLPPLPPDFQSVGSSSQPVSQPVPEPSGSAAPSDIPPIISPTPKKKFGGGRIIATILGFLILAGGIVGGVVLTQQQQDIREKAVGPPYEGPVPDKTIESLGENQILEGCVVETVTKDKDGNIISYKAEGYLAGCGVGGGEVALLPGSSCPAGQSPNFSDTANSEIYCCKVNPFPQYEGRICREEGGRVKNLGVSDCTGAGMIKQQVAPCSGGSVTTTAQCLDVKAYSTTWSALFAPQLAQLKANDQVSFCVRGSTSQQSFDRAKFKINNVDQPETTTRRPGSTNEFCQTYTIPAGTTTFNITAQVHHPTLGWK